MKMIIISSQDVLTATYPKARGARSLVRAAGDNTATDLVCQKTYYRTVVDKQPG